MIAISILLVGILIWWQLIGIADSLRDIANILLAMYNKNR